MRHYNLTFEGSILDKDRRYLPTYSGIYLVYVGSLSEDRKHLICRDIIYIGKAIDIRQRLVVHERRIDFLAELQEGEELFYSYAKVEKDDLDRVESALIYDQQPKLNTEDKFCFPYPATEIVSEGQCALLNKIISLEGTRS